ncbi:MAG: hypothetical protein ACOX5Q_00645 [Bacillota bacterium]|jgi:hypothetical protein
MKRPLVLFMVLWLALACVGCSVEPLELSFEKLTARITGLKLHDREPYEATDPRAVDLLKKVLAGGPDGLSGYFIRMRQETPETGWRIDSIGTGP